MERRYRTSFLTISCLLTFALPLASATFVVRSDRELIEASSAVVVGTVAGSSSRYNANGRIETVTALQVEEVVKGDLQRGETIELVELGGVVGNRAFVVPGSPSFSKGSRLLLLLDPSQSGSRAGKPTEWTTKDFALGKFEFTKDSSGRSLLVRDREGIDGWGPGGLRHTERLRSASAFLTFVRETTRGANPRPDYFLAPIAASKIRSEAAVIQPSNVPSQYLTSISILGVSAFVRWNDFPAAHLFLTHGTQANAPGGGPAELNAAVSVWTGAAGSNINYQNGGSTNASGGLNPGGSDVVNSIQFNDPNNEIPGSYVNGGALALGGYWATNQTHTFAGQSFFTIYEGDIIIQDGLSAGAANALTLILAHELGHTLGFRHSDDPVAPSTTDALMVSFGETSTSMTPALKNWDKDAASVCYGSGVLSCTGPAITQQPQSQTVTAGTSVTLSVVATGDAPLAYEWFKDGVRVAGAAGSSITFTPAATATYNVVVKNGCNPSGVMSAAATVTVTQPPAPPQIIFFTAVTGMANGTIPPGGTATLNWNTANATSVFIDQGVGSQPLGGSVMVKPQATTTYTLTASGPGGSTTAQTTVRVGATVGPAIKGFSAVPPSIDAGQSTSLVFDVSPGATLSIDRGVGDVTGRTQVVVSPRFTITYTLTATDATGTSTAQTTVTVKQAPLSIVTFLASPSPIPLGKSSTLFFEVTGATSVTIDNGVGTVPNRGSFTVSPKQTTTYTLTATAADGTTKTAQVTVDVITQPLVILTGRPRGLVQPAGFGGATDRYVVTNIGGAVTTISLNQTGDFFTQSPTSFSLAPGESQVIALTGLPRTAGPYAGTSNISGGGVPGGVVQIPVLLISAPPPVGTVRPAPSTNRVDVTGPTGSFLYTNGGTATLQGILVSDVPWIIPQGGAVTIPSGQTVTISFSIDRSKRPDADAPNGSVNGHLSLVYLRDGDSGLTSGRIESLDSTPVPASRPITVVDTAAPVTISSAVPALAANEIAFYLPGMAHRTNLLGDLSIVNGTSSLPLTNSVKLFYTAAGTAGAAAQSAQVSTLAPNVAVQYADVVQSVFKKSDEAGALQVRSSKDANKLSLNGTLFSTQSTAGYYGGVIPVFRSDRAAGLGEKLFLPGLKKDSTTRSDFYLQETSGSASTGRIEYFDANGTSLKTDVKDLGAFGDLEIQDAAPNGAVSAVLTQTAGAGRIVGHALVVDLTTGDRNNVVDWNKRNGTSYGEPQLIPLAETKSVSGSLVRTDVVVLNTGTIPATGVLSYFSAAAGRKRGTSRAVVSANVVSGIESNATVRTLSIDPGKTLTVSDLVPQGSSGYLVFTPSAGSVAITARTIAAAGNYGASIPAVALSTGLRSGATRQITQLEDAALDTVAAKKPGTFRTGFGLIETAGSSVTVRATLRYSSTVPGGLANVRAVASQTYTIAARSSLVMTEVGRAIFGAGRDSVGDLHNLQLDFEVISGDGAVVAYTISTDNGTGDSFVRME